MTIRARGIPQKCTRYPAKCTRFPAKMVHAVSRKMHLLSRGWRRRYCALNIPWKCTCYPVDGEGVLCTQYPVEVHLLSH